MLEWKEEIEFVQFSFTLERLHSSGIRQIQGIVAGVKYPESCGLEASSSQTVFN